MSTRERMICGRDYCGHRVDGHNRGTRCDRCPCPVAIVEEGYEPQPQLQKVETEARQYTLHPPKIEPFVLDLHMDFDVTPEGYRHFIIEDAMIKAAEGLSARFGELKNSIRKGEGNVAGCVGEIAVACAVKGELADSFDFDVLRKNVKIEVKTKVRTVKPKPHFNCSVVAANASQKCDVYMFVTILRDMTNGWIVGYLSRDDFFRKAAFGKKGDPDGEGFDYRADCHNVKIGDLETEV